MYEAFYKLTAKPFRLSPDPQFFYPSAGHKRALSYLLYGLNQAEGFVVITGAPGTGKTTLAHKLLSQNDAQSVIVAHLASTQIEAEDLLRLVAASFKLRSEHVSKASLLKDIESFLMARARERKRCLLVVDEAQNLPPRSIEELRMLSNFQLGNKALMQVFLLGQEQFRVMLDSPDFEQLRQRVIADYHLHPLDAAETRHYIEARLQHAGWQNDPQIDPYAHAMIFEYTSGLPRRINIFCDRLFLFGYLEGLHTLTPTNVSSVIAEMHNEILPRSNDTVFTPTEKPSAPVAALEQPKRASVTEITPSVALPIAAAVVNTARPAIEAVVALKSATPGAAARRAAPLAETAPVEPIRTPAPSLRNVVAMRPVPDTPSSTIEDFLLTDERGLYAADNAPRTFPSTSPSLAVTESRWLLMIVAAFMVLGVLVFWFYPSIRGALRQTQPQHADSRAPLTSDTTEASPALMQQITDPSENVLTEKRILVSAPPAIRQNEFAGVVAEAPRRSNEAVATPAAERKVPATMEGNNKLATHALGASPKSGEQEQKKSPNTTLNSNSAQQPTTSLPPPAAKPTSVTTTAVDSSASTGAISQRELALLVLNFARYYDEGNLPQFLSLFDAQVRTEDSNTIDAIRNDYTDLFKKTAARQILLGDIHWENTGRLLAQGTGSFEVRISATEGEPARALKGQITFHVEKKDAGLVIIALYHSSH